MFPVFGRAGTARLGARSAPDSPMAPSVRHRTRQRRRFPDGLPSALSPSASWRGIGIPPSGAPPGSPVAVQPFAHVGAMARLPARASGRTGQVPAASPAVSQRRTGRRTRRNPAVSVLPPAMVGTCPVPSIRAPARHGRRYRPFACRLPMASRPAVPRLARSRVQPSAC